MTVPLTSDFSIMLLENSVGGKQALKRERDTVQTSDRRYKYSSHIKDVETCECHN